ncbi:MAG: RNA polymerase sigma-70 factor [Acidobacteria bacterium]|nr:RNA polymerase sigma-70 factor [Acidobacteriota bacterium]
MEDFQTYRPLLFSIAYRMLGCASVAEDIVQDAYLRYSSATIAEVRSLKSYLSTIVTNLCLDYLKSVKVERENYIGLWLPEPLLTSEDDFSPVIGNTLEQHESLSIAFLALLERLTPQERAVFLLYEVFEYNYKEIAEILSKTEASCRQLFHRAKERVEEKRPRFEPSREIQERLMMSFLVACQEGNLEMLTALLKEDVVMQSDSGGKVTAARRPILGRDFVIKFYFGIVKKAAFSKENFYVTCEEINGLPSILTWSGEKLLTITSFEIDDEKIQNIYAIANPEKVTYLSKQLNRVNQKREINA